MRYGIISDIHGNLESIEAVLKELQGVDAYICLGDIVGYGPNPNECVSAVEVLEGDVVVGNHDLATLGLMDIEFFNQDAKRAILWTRDVIDKKSRDFLVGLPKILHKDDISIVHGSLRHYTEEYILSVFDAKETFRLLRGDICLVGHTHVACYFKEGEGGEVSWGLLKSGDEVRYGGERRLIVNVGSVGQPRDGDNRASFGILDARSKTVWIKRVSYPIERTQRKMRERGLPVFLIDRLQDGV